MNKSFVIFNPAARGEKSQRLRKFLESKANGSVVLAPTTQPGDAQRLAAQAVAQGCGLVIAAGGDGTVNEIVNGIGTSAVPLAVLPLGTVNVLARELGIPMNLEEAWAVAERRRERVVDLGRTEAGGAVRFFVQLAGVGFDAWAVKHASWELKKKIGPLSYVWAGLQAVAMASPKVEVRADREGRWERGAVVLVGNGRFYGGTFAVFPQARMDDGRLDVCVFENGGYVDVVRYALGVMRGAHTGLRDVKYFQADHFVCTAHGVVPFELDGEMAGETPVTFSVVPRALRVVVP